MKRLVITLGLLLLAGQAKAADPVNLELWQQQARINQLMQKRVTHLETRVAELERRVGSSYTPGSPPPQANEKHRERAAKCRRLIEEIGRLTRRIDKERASVLDDEDVIRDEVIGLQQRIAEREKELATLDSQNDEGEER